jgi:hypothetical protein
MPMKVRTPVRFAFVVSTFFASTAFAHHSNAMFDHDKQVDVVGTVREFQWTNPHVFIELTVDSPGGPQNFSIECSAPAVLRAHGWKFNSLKAGDKVVAKVHPLKNGSVGGGLISLSKDGVVVGDGGNLSPGYTGDK